MKPLRICVISSTVFQVGHGPSGLPGYGGLECIAWETAKGLAAKGHQVALVAPDGSTCPGCEIIPTGPAGQHGENQAYNLYWKYLPSFDVVCDHSWQKHSFLLKQEGRLQAPILAVCHAPISTMYQSLPEVEKPCFVCISQDQCNHFNALFSPITARVAMNGIDVSHYQPLNVPRTDRFLFLARFSAIKGPMLAIDACLQAGVGLDLVGDCSITGEPELYQQCYEKADGDQIKIIGGVSRGETVFYYSQAHCMLHPNKFFREPMGLAPVESQACKTPVISWQYGAMPETVIDGQTGWLVKSIDELVDRIKFAANGGITPQMREQCRQNAERFTIAHMVDRYESLCYEALEGGW